MLLRPEEHAFLFSQPYRGAVHESVACPCASSSPSSCGVGLRARQRVGLRARQRVGSEARRSSACTRVGRSSVSTSACAHTRVSWSWARLPRSCRLSPGRSRREGGVVRRSAEAGTRGVDGRARGPARPRAPRPRGPPAGTRTRRSMAVKTGRGLGARRAALGGRARAVRQRIGLFFRHSFLHEGSVRGAPAACRALSPVKRKAGEGRKVHGRVGRDLRRPWRAAGRDPQPRGGGPWARAV